MKNYVEEGRIVVVAAPANQNSGDFVMVGAIGGVCQSTVLSGADCPLLREGVFTLPKATGAAWAKGDQLYWDAADGWFTKTSSGNVKWGVAFAAALSADAVGQVSFTQVG